MQIARNTVRKSHANDDIIYTIKKYRTKYENVIESRTHGVLNITRIAVDRL